MSKPIKPLYLKQHDLQPAYTGQAFNYDGTAHDLTGATITANMLNAATGVVKFSGAACLITNAAAGEFEYQWQTGDTDAPGEYNIEFEINPTVGGKYTLPTDNDARVVIRSDFNGA